MSGTGAVTDSLPRAVERKITLDGRVLEYDCRALVVVPNKRAVLRYVVDAEMEVGNRPLVVTDGTISIAHYWAGRPYNVYHWLDGEQTLALYCNAGQTVVIDADCVVYRDLELDVLILPTGEAELLDEDRMPLDLPAADRSLVEAAKTKLLADPPRLLATIERATRDALRIAA